MTIDLPTQQVFYSVSTQLGIRDPNWLIDLVNFESGMNPKASNPLSSAKGLIQFINSTAVWLGYKSSQDLINKHPTIISQLEGPVYDYLKHFKPFNTESSLYLSVFYPDARNYPADMTFKEIFEKRGAPETGKGSYADFISKNPGILTPQHYINYVKRKPITRVVTKTGIGIIGIGFLYLLYTRLRG